MKLIPKETARQLAEHWFTIPNTHQLVDAGYYRSDKMSAPFYTLEMKWTPGGRPYLTKRGLVASGAIEVSIDALTGRIVSYINRSLISKRKTQSGAEPNGTKETETMDENTYRSVYAVVRGWIKQLDLPIGESELVLQRGTVRDNGEYELEYRRFWNEFWLFEYQVLTISLDENHRLTYLQLRWDDVDFELPANYIAESEIRHRISQDCLDVSPALFGRGPFWFVKTASYHAVTGKQIPAEETYESIRTVVCIGNPRGNRSKLKRKPLLSEEAFELLRLPDDITDVSLSNPEPFAPFLTDTEENLATEAACQFVQNFGNHGEVFTLVRRSGEPLAEVLINRVGLRFFRGEQGWTSDKRVVAKDLFVVWLNRGSWEVINYMERSELRKAFGIKAKTDEVVVPQREAWEKFRDRLTLRLGFRLDAYDLQSTNPLRRKATLEYRVTCDWRCDARTGEVFRR